MHIDKLYFTLPEVLERWRISETDLVYLTLRTVFRDTRNSRHICLIGFLS